MKPSYEYGFNLALRTAYKSWQEAFCKMRAEVSNALWEVDFKTKQRVFAAIDDVQRRDDWHFDID